MDALGIMEWAGREGPLGGIPRALAILAVGVYTWTVTCFLKQLIRLVKSRPTGIPVLTFISDFGKPTAPLPAAIVVCVPAKAHTDGMGESEFKIHLHEITIAIITDAGEKAKTNESILLEGEVIEKNVESGLQSHPLFFIITLGLLAEVINSRYTLGQCFILSGRLL
ncbi:hypothetical protein ZIOFF_050028 [Zingiber officinale]|uniref:Uncharacterized protein n=1 Tax=Zingiber officinale TaxID=94328 RepID=A0A8J5KQ92_ZINOF|nr:hypothetical protein ZIOFF_050028 [Zingiber officinale]